MASKTSEWLDGNLPEVPQGNDLPRVEAVRLVKSVGGHLGDGDGRLPHAAAATVGLFRRQRNQLKIRRSEKVLLGGKSSGHFRQRYDGVSANRWNGVLRQLTLLFFSP